MTHADVTMRDGVMVRGDVSRVDADVDALKVLREALRRYASAQRFPRSQAGSYAQDALDRLAERVSQCRAELDGGGMSAAEPDRDAADRYEHALRWHQRVDEQYAVYLVVAERLGIMLEEGVPRAQAALTELIARLDAARAASAPAGTGGMP